MPKYYILDQEEQEIENYFEKHGFPPTVKNLAQIKKKLKEAAKLTLDKIRNINLRLSERTVHQLKSRAAHEGIPYQTLAGSILHKYASGQFDK